MPRTNDAQLLQICLDRTLSRSPFEGEAFSTTIGYLQQYLTQLRTHPELLNAINGMASLSFYEKAITQIARIGEKTKAHIELTTLSKTLCKTIIEMSSQAILFLPGGYVNPLGVGHAMIYEIARHDTGWTIYIHNSGSGLQKHERSFDRQKGRILYRTHVAIHLPDSISEHKLAICLYKLLLPQVPELSSHFFTKMNANVLYEDALSALYQLAGIESLTSFEGKPHTWTSGQLSGTCAYRVLDKELMNAFENKGDYQRVIFDFKLFVLNDYMRSPRTELWQKRAIQATSVSLLRTLKKPGLFSFSFIQNTHQHIKAHLMAAQKDDTPALPVTEDVLTTAPKGTFTCDMPDLLSTALYSPEIQSHENPRSHFALIKIEEGHPPTLSDLQSILLQVSSKEKAPYAIVRQLEDLFLSFPNPAFDDTTVISNYLTHMTAANVYEWYETLDELHHCYVAACQEIKHKIFTSRMFVVGLQLLAFLDAVSTKLPLTEKYPSIIQQALGDFFSTQGSKNPALASYDPELDRRLCLLIRYYSVRKRESFNNADVYEEILRVEKQRIQLVRRDQPGYKVAPFGMQELIENFKALKRDPVYTPLVRKCEAQLTLEKVMFRISNPSRFYEENTKPLHGYNEQNHADFLHYNRQTKRVSSTFQLASGLERAPYGFHPSFYVDKPTPTALSPRASVNTTVVSEGIDNIIQLSSTHPKKHRQTDGYFRHPLNDDERRHRSLNHLRSVSEFQIVLTLEFFNQHLSLFSETSFQHYFRANLFEPGLLLEALKTPDIFFKKWDELLKRGHIFHQSSLCNETELFLLEIASDVLTYAISVNPHWVKKLVPLQEKIKTYLSHPTSLPSTIVQQLLFLQAHIAWIRYQHQDLREPTEILALTLPYYFYPYYYPGQVMLDSHRGYAMASLRNALQPWIIENHSSITLSMLTGITEVLGYGVCQRMAECNETTLTVWVSVDGNPATPLYLHYNSGQIQSSDGHWPTTADRIKDHPILKTLGFPALTPCFGMLPEKDCTEGRGRGYEIGYPGHLRFRQKTKDTWVVTKSWSYQGKTSWYEHTKVFNTFLPRALQEESHAVWIPLDKSRPPYALISKGSSLRYLLIKNEHNEDWKIHVLNDEGRDSLQQLVLNIDSTLHHYCSEFEPPQYQLISQATDGMSCTITLPRYDVTLVGQREKEGFVFHLRDAEDVQLQPGANPMGGLSVINTRTHQQQWFIPVHGFVCEGEPSSQTWHYRLQRDVSSKILKTSLEQKEGIHLDKTFLSRERFMIYTIGKDGHTEAETTEQALYLLYLYLAKENIDHAWKTLDQIEKKLGGLQGTTDELHFLRWILLGLPFLTQEQHSVQSPDTTVCQLKALLLFIQATQQDRQWTFPTSPIDGNTPIDVIYQNSVALEDQRFADAFGAITADTLRRYFRHQKHQRYQRYLSPTQEFQLLAFVKQKNDFEAVESYDAVLLWHYRKALLTCAVPDYQALLLQENLPIFDFPSKQIRKKKSIALASSLGDVAFSRTRFSDEEKESLRKQLTPIMPFEKFLDGLYYWIELAKEQHPALIEFCQSCIILWSHAEEKEKSHLRYWAHALLHIAQHAEEFSALHDISDIIKKACSYETYESTTTEEMTGESVVLCTTKDIHAQMSVPCPRETPVPLKTLFSPHNHCASVILDMAFEKTELQIFYKASAIFGQAVPGEKRETLADEVRAGNEQYRALQTMKAVSKNLLGAPNVRKIIIAKLSLSKPSLEDKKQALLALANERPTDLKQAGDLDFDTDANLRAPIEWDELLCLYLRGREEDYLQHTTLTSPTAIGNLHQGIADYLSDATAQQTKERLVQKLTALPDTPTDSEYYLIAQELFALDHVNPGQDRALAILQYRENILLRPEQVGLIRSLSKRTHQENSFDESVRKMIMGGGKTKVVIPALAYLKADGNNLVVIEVPRALIETNFIDLAKSSLKFFNQKAYRFEFDRTTDCSIASLTRLRDHLMQVITSKSYLVTTEDTVPSLYSKYMELLFQRENNDDQIRLLEQIISFFKTRGDVVMDEVDLNLWLKKKLNFSLGAPVHPDPKLIEASLTLYRFLNKVPLKTVGKGITAAQLITNPRLLTNATAWEAFSKELSTALITHPESPIAGYISGMSDQDTVELCQYLRNECDSLPRVVKEATDDAKTCFAFYKQQLSQHQTTGLLAYTLQRNLHEHYGPSKDLARSPLERAVSIPYLANNVPNERCHFGSVLETINYTIQGLLKDGFSRELLKDYLTTLQQQARDAHFHYPADYPSLDKTPQAIAFAKATPGYSLFSIPLDNLPEAVYQALCLSRELIDNALEKEILPKISIDRHVLHTNALNHVDMYRSCQGLTGTPWNSPTYHHRIHDDKALSFASDGFIIQLLKEKKTRIHGVDISKREDLVQRLLRDRENSRAIIDICATFKGISNLDVAKQLAKHLNPAHIKHVLYFNESNQLSALSIRDPHHPIVIASSDPDAINQRLGSEPHERFTYYDQAHTVGVDLRQGSSATAIALCDSHTLLRDFLQGCMRMRGLANEQTIEVMMPKECEHSSLESLIDHMSKNEQKALKKEAYHAALAKMQNEVRTRVINELLCLQSLDQKYRYAAMFQSYFIDHQTPNIFEQYGNLIQTRDTKDILVKASQQTIADWCSKRSRLGNAVSTEEKNALEKTMAAIVEDALRYCELKNITPIPQALGEQMEVQHQVQVQIQQVREVKVESAAEKLLVAIYKPWGGTLPTSSNTQSLSQLCNTHHIDFGALYASSNFIYNYHNQKDPLDGYLKPVLVMMFRQRTDGELECFLLSQIEADEIRKTILSQRNPHEKIWLGTTEHTVLAGDPPSQVIESSAYQKIIETVRFFNGELYAITHEQHAAQWVDAQKMEFFKNVLQPIRGTSDGDVVALEKKLGLLPIPKTDIPVLEKEPEGVFSSLVQPPATNDRTLPQTDPIAIAPPAPVKTRRYSWLLACLAGVSAVAGGALLVVALLTGNAILLGLGIGLIVLGAGSATYSFFNSKPPIRGSPPHTALLQNSHSG